VQEFLWNPAWNTGVAEIDDQHRELFRRMGDLALSLTQGRQKTETGKVLIYLRQYVGFHFDTEEALMLRLSYPGLDQHKLLHDEMRVNVGALVEAYLAEGNSVPGNLMDFLVTWLLDHIDRHDKALATFLKDQASR
jgi:hemerythrin